MHLDLAVNAEPSPDAVEVSVIVARMADNLVRSSRGESVENFGECGWGNVARG